MSEEIYLRAGGLAALLLAIYDAGYCAGAQLPRDTTGAHPIFRDLLVTLAERHRTECLAPRGWADPPPTADDLPGWLLSLPNRDAQPLEGWGAEGWPV